MPEIDDLHPEIGANAPGIDTPAVHLGMRFSNEQTWQ